MPKVPKGAQSAQKYPECLKVPLVPRVPESAQSTTSVHSAQKCPKVPIVPAQHMSCAGANMVHCPGYADDLRQYTTLNMDTRAKR